jgi:hypothetical protein
MWTVDAEFFTPVMAPPGRGSGGFLLRIHCPPYRKRIGMEPVMKLFAKAREASEAVAEFPQRFAESLAMLTMAILFLAVAVLMTVKG